MATIKHTMKRGEGDLGAIASSAGAAEAQTDTISINIDTTNLSKGEALIMIDKIKEDIARSDWPPA